MAEIESAEAFARKVFTYVADSFIQRWRPAESKAGALKLIEARDNAVRLALLNEIASRVAKNGSVEHGLSDIIEKYSPTSTEEKRDG